ncbi:MAG: VanW family protein [Clostridia bacterium]|nr:VanW family protein [Clostridia bacterium]
MRFKRWIFLLLCCVLIAAALPATAEPLKTLLDEAVEEGVAEEDLPVDEDQTVVEMNEEGLGPPSIAGLSPLYTTKVKLLTSSGNSVTVRYAQDTDSKGMGSVGKGEVVTIYKVYPAFVLIERNGVVGYILRTCIDENCTVLDPALTPPYGVMPTSYVATVTEDAPVYKSPSTAAPTNPIIIGEGNKIAIMEFVNGFAKVVYWRSYGYVDARLLKDMTPVSATVEPYSEETPIAAFTSFFAYNTGAVGNEGRCKNIVRSCELMSRVLQPEEELNFNAHIGPYSRANGYFPAPILVDGGTQIGSGGGTCQSSSTMYNTIRQLPGVTILMRRPHGPGSARYLPQHTDAAVGNSNLNLIFRNDYDFPLRILAESDGRGALTIQIFREDA